MAPRNPSPPSPQNVRAALMYLVRVAHAHAIHSDDVGRLQVILDKVTRGVRLTGPERARVRAAQDEARRHLGGWDRASSVRFVLSRRLNVRDRHAARALRELVAAGTAYAPTYRKRAMEPQSVRIFEAMRAIYQEVREGLPMNEQQQRVRALFQTHALALPPKHLKALLRTDRQISDAGGPNDCALKRVSFVFSKGETVLREQRKRPQLPPNIADVAFGRFSSMIEATQYVLALLGWEAGEVSKFAKLARSLYVASDRTPETAFMLAFTGPRTESAALAARELNPPKPVRMARGSRSTIAVRAKSPVASTRTRGPR